MGIIELKQAVRINQELDAPAPHSWVMGADKGGSGFPGKQKPALRNSWGMLSLGFCLPNQSQSFLDYTQVIIYGIISSTTVLGAYFRSNKYFV